MGQKHTLEERNRYSREKLITFVFMMQRQMDSLSETAKLNELHPYYYFKHILTELSKICDDQGNIDTAKLDQLLP